MTSSSNRNQLTASELQAYQAGQLTGQAQHRVERLLLENPFYADALEGLDALQQAGTSVAGQTSELRDALHRRIQESATERRLLPLWLTALTAAIILMVCVAIYLILFSPNAKPPPRHPRTVEVKLMPLPKRE